MSNPTTETTVAAKVTVTTVLTFPEVADRPRLASVKGARQTPQERRRGEPLRTRPFLVERLSITWTFSPGWRSEVPEWHASTSIRGRHMLTSGGMGADDDLNRYQLTAEGEAWLDELIGQHRPTGNPTLVWE